LYTSTELKIMSFGAAIGACFNIAVGGVDNQMTALIILVSLNRRAQEWVKMIKSCISDIMAQSQI